MCQIQEEKETLLIISSAEIDCLESNLGDWLDIESDCACASEFVVVETAVSSPPSQSQPNKK